MTRHVVSAPKVSRRHVQKIEGSPARAFALLCPSAEEDWLDGWRFEMVHSVSGVAEKGCVFLTRQHGAEPTLWFTSDYEPDERIRFIRFTPGAAVTEIDIRLAPAAHGCDVDIRYTITGLAPGAEAALAAFSRERWTAMMDFWERSMNHYLKTGERLAAG